MLVQNLLTQPLSSIDLLVRNDQSPPVEPSTGPRGPVTFKRNAGHVSAETAVAAVRHYNLGLMGRTNVRGGSLIR